MRLPCGAPPSSPPTARTLSRGCVSTGPRRPQQDLSLSLSCPLSPHTRAWASKVQTPPHLGRRPAGAQVRRFLPSSLLTCPACSRIHQRPLSFLFLKEPETRVTMVEETPPPSPLPGVGEGRACCCRRDGGFQNGAPGTARKGSAFHVSSQAARGGKSAGGRGHLGQALSCRRGPGRIRSPCAELGGAAWRTPSVPQAGGSATQHWAPPSSAVTHRCQFSQPQEVPCAPSCSPTPRAVRKAPPCATCPGPSVTSDAPRPPSKDAVA